MSSKFMNDLREDHPQLQRQLGCMTGIFQIFDRRYLLAGSRRVSGQPERKLPSSGKRKDNGRSSKQTTQNSRGQQHAKQVNKEVHHSYTESSVTSSSSSSCSSSFHSMDCTRGNQAEACSQNSHHKFNHGEQRRVISSRLSGDFRDFVTDSIHRETRLIAVKADTEGRFETIPLNYMDSPRPLPRKNLKSASCKETFRELHQVQDPHTGFTPDCSVKDVRRFSFDGRTSQRIKLKELPRFSLDSRATAKNTTVEMEKNYLTQDMWRNGSSNLLQEPGSLQRQSSVVAKLMGLDASPEPVRTSQQTAKCRDGAVLKSNSLGRSSRTENENHRSHTASSPRNLKGSSSPRVAGVAPEPKRHTRSKSLNELASWNQIDATSTPQSVDRTGRATDCISVNGDTEKSIGKLDVKDLRAIEQLLEAMKKSEEKIEGRTDASRGFNHLSKLKFLNLGLDYQKISSEAKSPTQKAFTAESLRSPIVVMKPSGHVDRHKLPVSPRNRFDDERNMHTTRNISAGSNRRKPVINSTVKESTLRNNEVKSSTNNQTRKRSHNARLISSVTSKKDQASPRDNSLTGRKQVSIRSKEEVEKQLLPSTPSMVCNVTIRQQSRQVAAPIDSPRKFKPKSLDKDESLVKSEIPVISQMENSAPPRSEWNGATSSPVGEELPWLSKASTEGNTLRKEQLSRRTDDKLASDMTVELPEQPSPVSVLDAKFCEEDPPSPVKKISISFTEPDGCDVLDRTNADDCQPSRPAPDMDTIDSKPLQSSQNAAASPQITDIMSLYERSSLEHKYIVEITATAGLLEEDGMPYSASHLTPSFHSIKPRFFFALEEARARQEIPDENADKHQLKVAKTRRKLVFDVVDEVLMHKMVPTYSFRMGQASKFLIQECPKGLPLLQELFCEVDRLTSSQSTFNMDEDDRVACMVLENLVYQSENWTSGVSEVPGLVLEIERLIFKDLLRDEFHVKI